MVGRPGRGGPGEADQGSAAIPDPTAGCSGRPGEREPDAEGGDVSGQPGRLLVSAALGMIVAARQNPEVVVIATEPDGSVTGTPTIFESAGGGRSAGGGGGARIRQGHKAVRAGTRLLAAVSRPGRPCAGPVGHAHRRRGGAGGRGPGRCAAGNCFFFFLKQHRRRTGQTGPGDRVRLRRRAPGDAAAGRRRGSGAALRLRPWRPGWHADRHAGPGAAVTELSSTKIRSHPRRWLPTTMRTGLAAVRRRRAYAGRSSRPWPSSRRLRCTPGCPGRCWP